jgi:hypothetical protein
MRQLCMARVVARLACAFALVVAAGCQGPAERAADRARADIAAYAKEPNDARHADVDADFARLEAEIATLRAEAARQDGDARERTEERVAALEGTRDDLRAEYLRAQAHAVTNAAEKAVRSVGETIGRGLEEAGKRIREAAGGKGSPSDTRPPDTEP